MTCPLLWSEQLGTHARKTLEGWPTPVDWVILSYKERVQKTQINNYEWIRAPTTQWERVKMNHTFLNPETIHCGMPLIVPYMFVRFSLTKNQLMQFYTMMRCVEDVEG